MEYPSLDELVSHGVHFGHRSSRWNPKMGPYIFTTRNKIHVINLEKTQEMLRQAMDYVRDLAASSGTVVFIATKRQARDTVQKAAQSCGMPFVTVRWLGGTFTNFRTIQKTVQKLQRLHQIVEADDFEVKYTKKERLTIQRQIEKLENLFSGIKNMKKLPEAIFVVDVHHEKIAIREANNSKVKVIGIVDTNSDPNGVDHIIPANDDAIKSITLIANAIAEAVNEGKAKPASVLPESAATNKKENSHE